MTQSDLAQAAGIADETVSRIERGRLVPSVQIAERVSKALRMSLSDLAEPGPEPKLPGPRQSEAKLLAVVRDMDDTDVEDIVRGIKAILAVGRRTPKLRRKS